MLDFKFMKKVKIEFLIRLCQGKFRCNTRETICSLARNKIYVQSFSKVVGARFHVTFAGPQFSLREKAVPPPPPSQFNVEFQV